MPSWPRAGSCPEPGLNVWFVGPELGVEGVATIEVGARRRSRTPAAQAPYFPPLAGSPHHLSRVELTLENALCRQAWAASRQWNQTYRVHTLANPVRPDLLWVEEHLIVEIDGPEHLDPEHFAADRRRDVDLQLAGYAVLRFTNAEVEHDVGAVVSRIQRFVSSRRRAA